jgi:hypothetical protein
MPLVLQDQVASLTKELDATRSEMARARAAAESGGTGPSGEGAGTQGANAAGGWLAVCV